MGVDKVDNYEDEHYNLLILNIIYHICSLEFTLARILRKEGTKYAKRRNSGMRPCNQSLRKTLDLTTQMLDLADEGDAVREDTGCGVLYSVLRDSAYKIKQLAEAERDAHQKKGWWEDV
jgi:hypothetical protein